MFTLPVRLFSALLLIAALTLSGCQTAPQKGLTPAQIRTAVRFAGLAGGEGVAMEDLIDRQLRNADRALGTRSADGAARPCVTTYDLDMLNVESRFEVPRIVM